MGLGPLDYIVIVAYLGGIAAIGVVAGGRQTGAGDYFLGSRNIPWWAACFAIVATETSTLTFVSIPGLAYVANMNFLQVAIGYVVGRIAICFILLPGYFRGDVTTAYQFLEARFGARVRRTAAGTFMVTRLLGDGVRLFATAIPLAILLGNAADGWGTPAVYAVSIVVMAAVTFAYTWTGGIRAVIWTDVVQMFLYLGAAVVAFWVLLGKVEGGWDSAVRFAAPLGKFALFNTGDLAGGFAAFIAQPYTLAASLIGGMLLSMASHGADQLIVQRLLTVKSLLGAQRALIWSGVIVMAQFALFLVIGVLLFVHYEGATLEALGAVKADEIFPRFIIDEMPEGLSGLIIAGLLAAAMSTLSGSINSLAAVSVIDFYIPLSGRTVTPEEELSLSRLISLVWTILLVGMAIFFIFNGSKVLVEIALGVASFTYGGLLGLFFLGRVSAAAGEREALIGFAAGVGVMIAVVVTGSVGWTWFTLIGSGVTVVTGLALARAGSRAA